MDLERGRFGGHTCQTSFTSLMGPLFCRVGGFTTRSQFSLLFFKFCQPFYRRRFMAAGLCEGTVTCFPSIGVSLSIARASCLYTGSSSFPPSSAYICVYIWSVLWDVRFLKLFLFCIYLLFVAAFLFALRGSMLPCCCSSAFCFDAFSFSYSTDTPLFLLRTSLFSGIVRNVRFTA